MGEAAMEGGGGRGGGLLIVAALVALGALGGGAAAGSSGPTSRQVAREQRYASQQYGIHGAAKQCLIALWDKESGWSATAVNQQTGAYGIPQANPADYGHPFALGDWQAQIGWGITFYIRSRYHGDPCAAWAYEQAHGSY